MTTITNVENLRQYKSRVCLIVELSPLALTFSTNQDREVKRMCFQISNELHDSVLRYR